MFVVKKYGLIGFPVSHSFSGKYFEEKFRKLGLRDHFYELFPLHDIQDLPNLIASEPLLQGFNVTIPHKVAVMPYLHSIDEKAEICASVNVVKIERKGAETLLHGFNTDYYGFIQSLRPLITPSIKKALVLGRGGSSLTVRRVLQELDIPYTVSAREAALDVLPFDQVNEEVILAHQLIINTTPLGMHPNEDGAAPINYSVIGQEHLLYDLIYNPAETTFLAEGRRRGARTKNGLEMLEIQAEESWRIWER